MEPKAWAYALAASGFIASAIEQAEQATAAPKKEKKTVECFGANSCKGSNSCGVSQIQLDLAQSVYKERFKATKLGECAGTAEGSAKEGHLAWIKKDGKQDCFKDGGFVYLKEKDGSLKIEDRSGLQKISSKKT